MSRLWRLTGYVSRRGSIVDFFGLRAMAGNTTNGRAAGNFRVYRARL
jgi:hypothetical protein